MKFPALRLFTALGLLAAGLAPAFAADAKLVITMMPKAKGNAYFISCKAGADKAAKELGVDLLFDGPTDSNAAKQNEIVENWITLGVDVITVAAENKEGLSTALRKAQKQGIKVLTYDADALPDARSFFVNQATPQGIAYGLVDEAARLMGGEGEFAITAVVLGGTSIFGGRGSVTGTLLGVAAIAVLKNGLACLPVVMRLNAAEEMSGMLTGALLLLALTGSMLPKILSALRPRPQAG